MPSFPRAARRQLPATLLLAAVSAATFLIYPALDHGPSRIFLQTPLDRAIPLIPVMVIPYLSLFFLISVTFVVFAIADTHLARSLALAVTFALLISYAVYMLAQSYVIRPPLSGQDWMTAMVRHVYSLDRPYNDFPSLHTSLSAIIAVQWIRFRRRAGVVVAAWCVLIIASTVLIHQHYLADVAAGLAVAWFAVMGSNHVISRFERSKVPVWLKRRGNIQSKEPKLSDVNRPTPH